MNSAVIIFSDDNLFVRYSLMKLKEDLYNSVIERSIDTENFKILIDEFIKEGIFEIKVICDRNLSIDTLSDIEDIMEQYEENIEFNYSKVMEDSIYSFEN